MKMRWAVVESATNTDQYEVLDLERVRPHSAVPGVIHMGQFFSYKEAHEWAAELNEKGPVNADPRKGF